jgi:hypothetical protein
MGEWSPENIGGEWQGGGSGKVDDRHIGHNRTAERAWSVPVMVTVAERGWCFEFVTCPDEGPYGRWTSRLEPSGTGTRVTKIWDVEKLPPALQSATQGQLDERARHTGACRMTSKKPCPPSEVERRAHMMTWACTQRHCSPQACLQAVCTSMWSRAHCTLARRLTSVHRALAHPCPCVQAHVIMCARRSTPLLPRTLPAHVLPHVTVGHGVSVSLKAKEGVVR